MAINKIIFGGNTLIDLTADTVTADKLANGITAHDQSGAIITGTSTKDVDSTDATAKVAEILNTKTAYARGSKLTGTMPNNGAKTLTISNVNDEITNPLGYHDGSGVAKLSADAKASVDADIILEGNTILGVAGKYKPETCKAHAKTATPSTSQQIIRPDSGYTHLTQVTVNAIPYVEADNSAGGTTVTIG